VKALLLRHLIVWPIAATAVLVTNRAFADDNDPAAIEQRLKAIETSPERAAMVREPAANARKTLKRVLDAHAAGDAAHAVELAALADDWTKLATNVVRAVELEKELMRLQDQLTLLEQTRRRTETLLEATIAQRERAREEVARLRAEKAPKLAASPREGTAAKTDTKAAAIPAPKTDTKAAAIPTPKADTKAAAIPTPKTDTKAAAKPAVKP
jgi:hypothetical protein